MQDDTPETERWAALYYDILRYALCGQEGAEKRARLHALLNSKTSAGIAFLLSAAAIAKIVSDPLWVLKEEAGDCYIGKYSRSIADSIRTALQTRADSLRLKGVPIAPAPDPDTAVIKPAPHDPAHAAAAPPALPHISDILQYLAMPPAPVALPPAPAAAAMPPPPALPHMSAALQYLPYIAAMPPVPVAPPTAAVVAAYLNELYMVPAPPAAAAAVYGVAAPLAAQQQQFAAPQSPYYPPGGGPP